MEATVIKNEMFIFVRFLSLTYLFDLEMVGKPGSVGIIDSLWNKLKLEERLWEKPAPWKVLAPGSAAAHQRTWRRRAVSSVRSLTSSRAVPRSLPYELATRFRNSASPVWRFFSPSPSQACRSASSCGVDGCKLTHHHLLHGVGSMVQALSAVVREGVQRVALGTIHPQARDRWGKLIPVNVMRNAGSSWTFIR